MFPLVSVITRTKNRSVFLKRCKLSLDLQIFKDFEWIIVIDGKGDHYTHDFLQSLKSSRLLYISKELDSSHGMEAASNVGISIARGKYITFLDDDDSWSPKFLIRCITFLTENSSYKGVATQTTIIKEKIKNGKIKELSRYVFNPKLISIGVNLLCKGNVFTNNSFVYERSVFDQIGRFDESLEVRGDWDFNLRFIEGYDIGVIPEPLAFWHHHESDNQDIQNSITSKKIEHRIYDDVIRNKYFRRDVQSGRNSIGLLLVMHQSKSVFPVPKSRLRRLIDFSKFF